MNDEATMSQTSKHEYLERMKWRYQQRGREGRSRLLDELEEICGYDRKYAIKLMNGSLPPPRGRRGRGPVYGAAELAVIKPIWRAAHQPCGKLLQPMLPLWLPHWEADHGPLEPGLKARLERISASTLDRLLAPSKAAEQRRRQSGTRPGTWLKTQIPIRTDHAEVDRPGYLEADTVAHCGSSLSGDFVGTLDLTDVHTQWTECRAVWNKGRHGIVAQIRNIEQQLPFPLRGFDSDNGSEFLNWHLVSYLQERGEQPAVAFTRSRPYHKNDNARVEQKNWTHARSWVGYERLDQPECVAALNAAYLAWCALKNYFVPVMKLESKRREGGRYRKRYDRPRTPVQRVLEGEGLAPEARAALEARQTQLNPFALRRQAERHLRRAFRWGHAAAAETKAEPGMGDSTTAGFAKAEPASVPSPIPEEAEGLIAPIYR
jgi:hypothetical protein